MWELRQSPASVFANPSVRGAGWAERRSIALFWSVLLLAAPTHGRGGTEPLHWDRRQQLSEVTSGVFEPASGRKTAEIRIGRVGAEYGKHGVLRVAWRRQAVFDDLEFVVLDSADWPRIAAAMQETVHLLARADALRIRRFVLRQTDGAQITVTAESAQLSSGGDLVLRGAVLAGAGGTERRREFVLPLGGKAADLRAVLPVPAAAPPTSLSQPQLPCAPQVCSLP